MSLHEEICMRCETKVSGLTVCSAIYRNYAPLAKAELVYCELERRLSLENNFIWILSMFLLSAFVVAQ
jgi:hypothetical protein